MAIAQTTANVSWRPRKNAAAARQLDVKILSITAPKIHVGRVLLSLVCLAALAITLVAILFFNVQMAQDGIATGKLRAESRSLSNQAQALQQQLQLKQSPQDLANQAIALGMVPNGAPAYLDLQANKIIGTPKVTSAAQPNAQLIASADVNPATQPAAAAPAPAPAPAPADPNAATPNAAAPATDLPAAATQAQTPAAPNVVSVTDSDAAGTAAPAQTDPAAEAPAAATAPAPEQSQAPAPSASVTNATVANAANAGEVDLH